MAQTTQHSCIYNGDQGYQTYLRLKQDRVAPLVPDTPHANSTTYTDTQPKIFVNVVSF